MMSSRRGFTLLMSTAIFKVLTLRGLRLVTFHGVPTWSLWEEASATEPHHHLSVLGDETRHQILVDQTHQTCRTEQPSDKDRPRESSSLWASLKPGGGAAPFCVRSWASVSRQWKMVLRFPSILWLCWSNCKVWGSMKFEELSNSGAPSK